MEEQKDMFALLDMMVQPVFCVKENTITKSNSAAQQLFLRPGDPVDPLLSDCAAEYAAFSEGCLCLSLSIAGQKVNAVVRRMEQTDVFELLADSDALRAMALAASQLRRPLHTALSQTAALLDSRQDADTLAQLSQLNRGLYQLLRMLGNMSDVAQSAAHCHPETTNAPFFLEELFEKIRPLAEHSGVNLDFEPLKESVYCLIDRQQLERAVLNILSNAMKFTPRGGRITASLTRRNRTLVLSVQDSGSGIAREVMDSLFTRHLRQPGIEDSRFGLGLGIRMIHTAAVHHGGTLLFSPAEGGGTRVVMTIAIRQNASGLLRSPVFEMDYTGGFDHSLVELSEVLRADLFDGRI